MLTGAALIVVAIARVVGRGGARVPRSARRARQMEVCQERTHSAHGHVHGNCSTCLVSSKSSVNCKTCMMSGFDCHCTCGGEAAKYPALWRSVRELQRAEAARDAIPPLPAWCPKVFVYDLPTEYGELSDWNVSKASITEVFGEPLDPTCHPDVRNTYQYALTETIYYRLWHSRCRTLDPAEADLFFVPVLPKRKRVFFWAVACNRTSHIDALGALPHLNRRTAHRHILMVGMEHNLVRGCTNWWENNGTSSNIGLLRHAIRWSMSMPLPELFNHQDNAPYNTGIMNADGLYDVGRYPNVVAIPHASSVHCANSSDPLLRSARSGHIREERVGSKCSLGSRADARACDGGSPPWSTAQPRPLLMLYVGDTYHGDVAVRNLVHRQCRSMPDDCHSIHYSYHPGPQLLMKQNATFCLEPGGDTPFRKSVYDSIAMGCIPVLFSPQTARAAPWLWEGWQERSRVVVPRQDFLAGRIELRELLRSMPTEMLREMQETLAANARRFQVSLSDDERGDTVHTLLHGAMKATARREHI